MHTGLLRARVHILLALCARHLHGWPGWVVRLPSRLGRRNVLRLRRGPLRVRVPVRVCRLLQGDVYQRTRRQMHLQNRLDRTDVQQLHQQPVRAVVLAVFVVPQRRLLSWCDWQLHLPCRVVGHILHKLRRWLLRRNMSPVLRLCPRRMRSGHVRHLFL